MIQVKPAFYPSPALRLKLSAANGRRRPPDRQSHVVAPELEPAFHDAGPEPDELQRNCLERHSGLLFDVHEDGHATRQPRLKAC